MRYNSNVKNSNVDILNTHYKSFFDSFDSTSYTSILDNLTYEDLNKHYQETPKIKPKYKHIEEYIKFLSDSDRSILEKYYYDKKRQVDITEKTQGGVSYRLKKIRNHLKFYIEHQKLLDLKLLEPFLSENQIHIIQEKIRMKSIAFIGKETGIGYSNTRYFFLHAIRKIEKLSETYKDLKPYLKMLIELSRMKNLIGWTPERQERFSKLKLSINNNRSNHKDYSDIPYDLISLKQPLMKPN